MSVWEFMDNHWFVSLLLALIAASLAKEIVYLPLRFYRARLRRQNIAQHGWPAAPLDADGDVVYPKPPQRPNH